MKRIINFLSFSFIFVCNCQDVFSQDASPLQWFDPAASSFSVIEGRGWQTALAHPYDRLPAKAENGEACGVGFITEQCR